MTSGRSLEQRARLSRESGLDLNRFDSVTHLVGSLGTRPNARLPEYGILSESLQSSSLPIYQFTNFICIPMYSSRICHVSGVRKGFAEIHRNTRRIQQEYTQNTQNTNLRATPPQFKSNPPRTRACGVFKALNKARAKFAKATAAAAACEGA